MVGQITGVIKDFVAAVWEMIVTGLTTLTSVFYAEEGLTFLGTVIFIGLALTLVFFVVRFIVYIIKR